MFSVLAQGADDFGRSVLQILVDYGGIILTVIGFESEEKYLKMKRH